MYRWAWDAMFRKSDRPPYKPYSLTVCLALTIPCVLLQTSGNAKAAQGAIRENLGKVLGSDEQQGKGAQNVC